MCVHRDTHVDILCVHVCVCDFVEINLISSKPVSPLKAIY